MRVLWLSALIVIIDQVTKILVHFTMYRGQSIPILGRYFRLTYTENPGMAFGLQIGPPGTITVFALVASGLIVYYLWQIRGSYAPYRWGLGLILGGAVGNIIDRIFYGKLLYAEPLFQGRVIDFIHFDIFRGALPEWIPFFGGDFIALFPIGNIADLSILAGVATVLLAQSRFHDEMVAKAEGAEAEKSEVVLEDEAAEPREVVVLEAAPPSAAVLASEADAEPPRALPPGSGARNTDAVP